VLHSAHRGTSRAAHCCLSPAARAPQLAAKHEAHCPWRSTRSDESVLAFVPEACPAATPSGLRTSYQVGGAPERDTRPGAPAMRALRARHQVVGDACHQVVGDGRGVRCMLNAAWQRSAPTEAYVCAWSELHGRRACIKGTSPCGGHHIANATTSSAHGMGSRLAASSLVHEALHQQPRRRT